jgi:hypothetical protein
MSVFGKIDISRSPPISQPHAHGAQQRIFDHQHVVEISQSEVVVGVDVVVVIIVLELN